MNAKQIKPTHSYKRPRTRTAPDPMRAARLRKARQELRAQEAQRLLESASISLDPAPKPSIARAIWIMLHGK